MRPVHAAGAARRARVEEGGALVSYSCLFVALGFAMLWHRQTRRADQFELEVANLRGEFQSLWSYAAAIDRSLGRYRRELAHRTNALKAHLDELTARLDAADELARERRERADWN